MRIMAGQACHRAFAFQEASGFAKPICCACDFKLVVVSSVRGVIEIEDEVLQWLPGNKGERLSIEPANQRGKAAAGRLKVALHAYIHLEFRIEPRRIDDAGTYICRLGARGLCYANVSTAGTMASLTVDSLWQVLREDGI